jgi:hypothetical protein
MRPLFERWQVHDPDRAAPVLTEVFLGICETAVQMMLDSDSTWQADDLAEIVGPAAYRALRAIPAAADCRPIIRR